MSLDYLVFKVYIFNVTGSVELQVRVAILSSVQGVHLQCDWQCRVTVTCRDHLVLKVYIFSVISNTEDGARIQWISLVL